MDPAEPGGDAMHVGIDGEGRAAHGERQHASRRLGADAGQRGEVLLNGRVVEVLQAGQVQAPLAFGYRGKDLLDAARFLVRDAARADGLGDACLLRFQDLFPGRELGFELRDRVL
jgi:hypothetical protein